MEVGRWGENPVSKLLWEHEDPYATKEQVSNPGAGVYGVRDRGWGIGELVITPGFLGQSA